MREQEQETQNRKNYHRALSPDKALASMKQDRFHVNPTTLS